MPFPVNDQFNVNVQLPIDDRTSFALLADRDAVPVGRLYEGLTCYVVETELNYQYKNGAWGEFVASGDIGDSTDYAREGYSARFGENFSSTDLADTLDKILNLQYAAPTISLSVSPSTAVREKGNSISSVTLTANTTKRSDPITSVDFYRNGGLIHTVAVPSADGSSNEVYVDNTTFGDNTSFYARVYDGTTWVNSNTANYTFVYPYYHGVGAAGLTGAQIASTLTKDVRASSSSVSVTTSPSNEHFYFCYPSAYPVLTSILDGNGFQTISAYTVRTVNIVGQDGTSQSYRVYELTIPTTQTNFTNTYSR